MKRYRCHKVVQAAKVVGYVASPGEGADMLQLEDGGIVAIPVAALANVHRLPLVGGYFVRYEDGYTSWSPAAAFEEGYREVADKSTGLTFGEALESAKWGEKIARDGWNGKGMWVEIQRPDAHSKMTLPYLFLNYPADAANTPGARVPWLASQTDILANDWRVLQALIRTNTATGQ